MCGPVYIAVRGGGAGGVMGGWSRRCGDAGYAAFTVYVCKSAQKVRRASVVSRRVRSRRTPSATGDGTGVSGHGKRRRREPRSVRGRDSRRCDRVARAQAHSHTRVPTAVRAAYRRTPHDTQTEHTRYTRAGARLLTLTATTTGRSRCARNQCAAHACATHEQASNSEQGLVGGEELGRAGATVQAAPRHCTRRTHPHTHPMTGHMMSMVTRATARRQPRYDALRPTKPPLPDPHRPLSRGRSAGAARSRTEYRRGGRERRPTHAPSF